MFRIPKVDRKTVRRHVKELVRGDFSKLPNVSTTAISWVKDLMGLTTAAPLPTKINEDPKSPPTTEPKP